MNLHVGLVHNEHLLKTVQITFNLEEREPWIKSKDCAASLIYNKNKNLSMQSKYE